VRVVSKPISFAPSSRTRAVESLDAMGSPGSQMPGR
jgi:hypothetical protein